MTQYIIAPYTILSKWFVEFGRVSGIRERVFAIIQNICSILWRDAIKCQALNVKSYPHRGFCCFILLMSDFVSLMAILESLRKANWIDNLLYLSDGSDSQRMSYFYYDSITYNRENIILTNNQRSRVRVTPPAPNSRILLGAAVFASWDVRSCTCGIMTE